MNTWAKPAGGLMAACVHFPPLVYQYQAELKSIQNMHCANHHRTASDPTNLHFTTETIEQSLIVNHSSGQATVNNSTTGTMGMHV